MKHDIICDRKLGSNIGPSDNMFPGRSVFYGVSYARDPFIPTEKRDGVCRAWHWVLFPWDSSEDQRRSRSRGALRLGKTLDARLTSERLRIGGTYPQSVDFRTTRNDTHSSRLFFFFFLIQNAGSPLLALPCAFR